MLIEFYATPADQPIQFSTKFDLVTNEKTSNALGLTVHRTCCSTRTSLKMLTSKARLDLDQRSALPAVLAAGEMLWRE
jgi:hypothetical protein